MFNVKQIFTNKLFSNKHRAYLLIFACAYLLLRLPTLVNNKVEKILINTLANESSKYGIITAYEDLKFALPANLSFSKFAIAKDNLPTLLLINPKISAGFPNLYNFSVTADVFNGNMSCNVIGSYFSSDLKVNCNFSNLEISEIAYIRRLSLNGPLSFKFSGLLNPKSKVTDINGEFLSQIDTSTLRLPKDVPSFIKVPPLGILDLKGVFSLKNQDLSLSETSIASITGDLDTQTTVTFSPNFDVLENVESILDLKLSSNGMQTIAPWVGLALGGIKYPSSGNAKIELKGNSTSGFKAKLIR